MIPLKYNERVFGKECANITKRIVKGLIPYEGDMGACGKECPIYDIIKQSVHVKIRVGARCNVY